MNAGSVFEVILPDVKTASLDEVSEPEKTMPADTVIFEPASILIAEDVRVNRELIKEFLGDYAFEVLEAENGEDAVVMAMRHRPDLILMDMRMPGLNGYEAVRRIRADEATAAIPVIAVSASTMSEEVRADPRPIGFAARQAVRKRRMNREITDPRCTGIVASAPPCIRITPSRKGTVQDLRRPVRRQQIDELRKALFGVLNQRLNERSGEAGGVIVIDRLETLGDRCASWAGCTTILS